MIQVSFPGMTDSSFEELTGAQVSFLDVTDSSIEEFTGVGVIPRSECGGSGACQCPAA